TSPKCFVSPSVRRTASTHGDGTLDLFRPLPSEVARPLRTLVLVDGEHHPPVVRAAIAELSARHRVVGAVFLGGGEKLADLATVELGLSLVTGEDADRALEEGLRAFDPEVVFDLSDQPVVDGRT